MSQSENSLSEYQYNLPEERIAQYPLKDRDASKLLVYENGAIHHEAFRSAPEFVPDNSLLFMNDTKVIAARLYFKKATGAQIEVFLTDPVAPHRDIQMALAVQEQSSWHCIIGNLKKWKDGDELTLDLGEDQLTANLISREDGLVQFTWTGVKTFSEIIEFIGHMPLPPYMKREDEEDDKQRYQTVFSKHEGAVAAPTAGLHFTNEILKQISGKGVIMDTLTLHVSAGTFRPIKSSSFKDHDMHNEQIIITRHNIINLLNAEGPVIAIGTTALRTLESLYWYGVKLLHNPQEEFIIDKNDPYAISDSSFSKEQALNALLEKMDTLGVSSLHGETEIFIYPGYEFRLVHGLFTNFHMPGSTLILLVAAFVGDIWKRIYQEALDENYRFLSYGDTSLLYRK